MPCNSDYMYPSEREEQSKKLTGLLCYVLEALDETPPSWAVVAKSEYYGDVKTLDASVKLLCALIQGFSPEMANRIMYDGRIANARQLADFWDRHQEADASRKGA